MQLEGGESTGETEGTTRSVREETQIIRSVEKETQILTRALIGRFIQFVQWCISNLRKKLIKYKRYSLFLWPVV